MTISKKFIIHITLVTVHCTTFVLCPERSKIGCTILQSILTPVARMNCLRIRLEITVTRKLTLHQTHVVITFIYHGV